MQWSPVNRATHALIVEQLDETVSIHRQPLQVQPNRKQTPRVDAVFRTWRKLDLFHIRQRLKIPLGKVLSLDPRCFGPFELMNPKGGGKLREVVRVTWGNDAAIRIPLASAVLTLIGRESIPRHLSHSLGDFRVVGHGHPGLRR